MRRASWDAAWKALADRWRPTKDRKALWKAERNAFRPLARRLLGKTKADGVELVPEGAGRDSLPVFVNVRERLKYADRPWPFAVLPASHPDHAALLALVAKAGEERQRHAEEGRALERDLRDPAVRSWHDLRKRHPWLPEKAPQ